MKSFDTTNLKQAITSFVRDWVKELSEGDFIKACDLLDTPDNENENILWNREILKEVFCDYGYGNMPVITNPYKMDLNKEKIDVFKYNDKTGFGVDYDLPLNNEWSDLTARFSFIRYTEDLYFTFLIDIHVL